MARSGFSSVFANWVSPLDLEIEIEGRREKLWQTELRDLTRGFCGALFLALPLLYTIEMWERARIMPPWDLAIVMALAYLANVGFSLLAGFKPGLRRKSPWFDAFTAMGLGFFASLITLLLTGRYSFDTPPNVMTRLVLLEMVPASFGANLAINQLGARSKSGSEEDKRLADRLPMDLKKLLATSLGALIFAFNIAPTIEPQVITYSLTWWHTLGLLCFSLIISYLMVFLSNFASRGQQQEGVLSEKWTETAVAYLVSLGISALLLWMFGYLNTDTTFAVAIAWVVTLGYATTLGGAAGRLIL